jgi:KDO2-lipid IV(A) lauroyltransferase
MESQIGYKSILHYQQKYILSLNLIIGDQSPRRVSAKHWTHFLKQKTVFLTGADKIVKKRNQVVLFPLFRKLKRGCYELEFKIITEYPNELKEREIIYKYARQLEAAIKDSPELWLWSHRRWKLTA